MPRRSPRNTDTLVADPRVIPSGSTLADEVKIHHELEPRGGLKALQDKGLRITSYSEVDGSGAPISRRYDDDDE
jgi:hypothetical protein